VDSRSFQAGKRAIVIGIQIAAVVAAAVVLLCRVAVVPSWNAIYAEDYGVFLVQALTRPWQLLVPYQGYEQLLPRLIAQGASLLPLTWAAAAFAISGAAVAALCALFVYHASAGYIRSPALRALLGAALILLPVAPLEIADSGVNSPWYVIVALFWAVLWRPQTRRGMAAAAIVAFAATASSPVVIVFAPLLAIRVFALRKPREHAVTAGWLAGWVVQAVAIAQSYADHHQRIGTLGSISQALGYYLNTVVLRAFGWHVSWYLTRALGMGYATLLCAVALLVILGLAMTTGRKAWMFVTLAVVSGMVFTVFTGVINRWVLSEAAVMTPKVSFEPASRYSALPIMLFYAAVIVGLDALAQRHGGLRTALANRSVKISVVSVALIGVLSVGWITDYSYPTQRTTYGAWLPAATRYLDACRHQKTVSWYEWTVIHGTHWVKVSCGSLVR
jgi:hypothetical protein